MSYPHDPFQPGDSTPQGATPQKPTPQKATPQGAPGASDATSSDGKSAGGYAPYGQQSPAQPVYGQSAYGESHYGQSTYGQADTGQPAYGKSGYEQWQSAPAGTAEPAANVGQPHQGYDANPGQPPQYGQPQYGQAGQPQGYGQQPGAGWGAQPAMGGGGVPPQRPKQKNKRLFLLLGIGGGALVLIVALVVTLIVVFTGDSGPGGSPKAAVQTYLEGLSSGDAKKALSVVRTPPSEKLLTDEVLKKQQATAKISDLNVREPSTSLSSMATVKATYKFGDRNADIDFMLKKSDGKWTVDNGTIPIDVDDTRVPQLTAFGVDVSKDSKVYVFPGPVEWGSANPNFSVKADNSGDFPLGPTYASYNSLKVELSDQGTKAVATALDTYFTNCAGSTQADASKDKPGCSQSLYQSVVPGSVRWTKPTDINELRLSPDYETPTSVKVYGSVEWPATYMSTSSGPGSYTDSDYLSGSVDLAAAQPTFTASR